MDPVGARRCGGGARGGAFSAFVLDHARYVGFFLEFTEVTCYFGV